MNINDVFTIKEASDIYNVKFETLRQYIKRGAIDWELNKDYKQSGKVWLITREALDKRYKLK